MQRPLRQPIAELVDYLRHIGFEELYLPKEGSLPKKGEASTGPAEISSEERRRRLEELATVAATCTRCSLSQNRNKVVFGSGDSDADLMFIGEGPGAEEDRQGLPFVGRAGELLTRIIQDIELEME